MSNKIEFYTTPEDLPMKRYQRFKKFEMIGSEVGSTFEDFDERTMKVIAFFNKKMYGDAIKELENRRQAAFNAYTEYNPEHYALALMVKSINGVDYTDKYYMTEEGMEEVLTKLEEIGYSKRQATNDLNVIKKKFPTRWKCITQSSFVQTTKQISISFLNSVLKLNWNA